MEVSSNLKLFGFKGGNEGRGIKDVVNKYLATNESSGITIQSEGWTDKIQTVDKDHKYLWNYEIVKYSDSSEKPTDPHIIGTFSENGTDGNGIVSITELYALSDSTESVPSVFSDSIPVMTQKNCFLWNKERITYTKDEPRETTPVIIGVYGPKGDKGDAGTSVKIKGSIEKKEDLASKEKIEGDGYLLNGDLWVFNNSKLNDDKHYAGFENVGKIQGPAGKTYYIHIAYANMVTGPDGVNRYVDFDKINAKGRMYLGICVNDIEIPDPDISNDITGEPYTWSLIRGEDGVSFERVVNKYKAVGKGVTPSNEDVGWNENFAVEYSKINADVPYLWNYEELVYSSASRNQKTTPAIIYQYTKDGLDGTSVVGLKEEYRLTDRSGKVVADWSTKHKEISPDAPFLWNRECVTLKFADGHTEDTPWTPNDNGALIGVYGEKGEDGTSVKIKPTENDCTAIGDAYINKSNGHLMVLVKLSPKQFEDAGKIQGPAGDNAWVHIIYAQKDARGFFDYSKDDTTGREWMGIMADNKEEDTLPTPNDYSGGNYKWSKITGEDGISFDEVVNWYKLSSEKTCSSVPNDSDPSKLGWTKVFDVLKADESRPYIWNFEQLVYSDKHNVNTTPSIIYKFTKNGENGKDGTSIIGVKEQYRITNRDGQVVKGWSETRYEMTESGQRLWNRECVTLKYDDGTIKDTEWTEGVVIGVYGDKGDDGTSVKIKPSKEECKQIGDGYIDKTTGNLMILTRLPNYFENAGKIQGPAGDKAYVHIIYAKKNVAGFYDYHASDPTGRDWMGVLSNNVIEDILPTDKSGGDYKWSYTRGEDGITIRTTPSTLIFKKKDVNQGTFVTVEVWDGSKKVPYGSGGDDGYVCGTLPSDLKGKGVDWNPIYPKAGEFFKYAIAVSADKEVDLNVPFTVTYKGVVYHQEMRIVITSDGEIVRDNILEGTNLIRSNKAWNAFNGEVVLDGGVMGTNSIRNVYNGPADYSNVLQQQIMDSDLKKSKISVNNWYTLSFWAKGSVLTTYIYGQKNIVSTTDKCIIDGVETSILADGRNSWKLTNEWVRHTYTFKTGLNQVYGNVLFRVFKGDNAEISAIKLEKGKTATPWCLNEKDKVGAKLRMTEWQEGKRYLSGAAGESFYDVVIFKYDAEDKGTLYLCTKTIDEDSKRGKNDPATNKEVWEVAQNWRFVATDLLLAKRIAAKDIVTEDITVQKLETDNPNGGATVKIENGTIQVFGTNKDHPSIEFGIDNAGNAVLRYFDQTGKFLYDLGPDQINEIKNSVFVPIQMSFLSSEDPNSSNMAFVIEHPSPTTYYEYHKGELAHNTLDNTIWKNNKLRGSDPDFTSNSKIANGWYTSDFGAAQLVKLDKMPTAPNILIGFWNASPSARYYVREIYKVVDGKKVKGSNRKVYW